MSTANQEIGVSICCLVYNHEKYLRRCLDGFVEQRTNFKIEVLIHDDASTDHSREIIEEYAEKYPEIFRPLYQKENQTSKGRKVSLEFQYPRIRGKYVAWCEGDDYWTDEMKLQKQYDMLEKNADKVFCTHIVRSISESGELLNDTHPTNLNIPMHLESEVWIKMLLGDSPYQFHTSSYFARADVLLQHINNYPEFMVRAKVGDVPIMMLYATYGGCIYLDQEMSCYRKQSVGSWSQRMRSNSSMREQTILASIDSFKAYDEFTNKEYTHLINNVCLREEFKYLQAKKNYKEMLHRKYRIYFKNMTVKEKIYTLISAKIPFVILVYTRLKKRGKYQNE